MKDAQNRYHCLDWGANPGVNFYRLKIVDIDGKYSFSPIRSIKIDPEPSDLNVYPNPATDGVTIETKQDKLNDYRLFDITGKDLTGRVRIRKISEQQLVLEVKNLSPGIYVIKNNSEAKMLRKL